MRYEIYYLTDNYNCEKGEITIRFKDKEDEFFDTITICNTPMSCGVKIINGIDQLISVVKDSEELKKELENIILLANEYLSDTISYEDYEYLDLDVPYYIISTTTLYSDKYLNFCTKLTPQKNPNSGNEINLYIYERFL